MAIPSDTLVWTFSLLTLLVAAALPAGTYWSLRRSGEGSRHAGRRALGVAVGVALWMTIAGAAAAAGVLEFGPVPPPMVVLFSVILIIGGLLGRSRLGKQLAAGIPLAALVGVQAFRLPLELLMHRAYSEGVMPVQMSFSGINFDILTGAGAIVVAFMLALNRMPLWGVKVWNWTGTLLLANIVTIAWLSAPTPLRVFHNEPANVWITDLPFVWLPSVLVMTAFVGHLLIFRRLRIEGQQRTASSLAGASTGQPELVRHHT